MQSSQLATAISFILKLRKARLKSLKNTPKGREPVSRRPQYAVKFYNFHLFLKIVRPLPFEWKCPYVSAISSFFVMLLKISIVLHIYFVCLIFQFLWDVKNISQWKCGLVYFPWSSSNIGFKKHETALMST